MPFEGLKPEDFIEIYPDSIETFLSNYNPDRAIDEKRIPKFISSISSNTDTIKSIALLQILNYFEKNNLRRFGIRNITEEEFYCLRAKINNTNYDPDSVKWESTGYLPFKKIGRDIKATNQLK